VAPLTVRFPAAGATLGGRRFGLESKTSVRIEVIPWETKAGQFGVAIWRDEMTDAYFVGSRSEAEREASRGPFE
jgi:hypothetical protein